MYIRSASSPSTVLWAFHTIQSSSYISRESYTTRNVLWSRASVCLCVCLSVRSRMPTLLHGPGCNLGSGRWCPLVVHYWADLQSMHGLRCYGNITRTRNVSEYMLVLALCLVLPLFSLCKDCGRPECSLSQTTVHCSWYVLSHTVYIQWWIRCE